MTAFSGQTIAATLLELVEFKSNLRDALLDKGMTSVGNIEGLPLSQWANLIRDHYVEPPEPTPDEDVPKPGIPVESTLDISLSSVEVGPETYFSGALDSQWPDHEVIFTMFFTYGGLNVEPNSKVYLELNGYQFDPTIIGIENGFIEVLPSWTTYGVTDHDPATNEYVRVETHGDFANGYQQLRLKLTSTSSSPMKLTLSAWRRDRGELGRDLGSIIFTYGLYAPSATNPPPKPEPLEDVLADTSFTPEPPPPEPPLPDFSEFDPPPEGQKWCAVWAGVAYRDGRLAFTLADLYAAYEETATTPQQHNQIVYCESLDAHGRWHLNEDGSRSHLRSDNADVTGIFIRRTTAAAGIGQDRYFYQRKITLLPVESV